MEAIRHIESVENLDQANLKPFLDKKALLEAELEQLVQAVAQLSAEQSVQKSEYYKQTVGTANTAEAEEEAERLVDEYGQKLAEVYKTSQPVQRLGACRGELDLVNAEIRKIESYRRSTAEHKADEQKIRSAQEAISQIRAYIDLAYTELDRLYGEYIKPREQFGISETAAKNMMPAMAQQQLGSLESNVSHAEKLLAEIKEFENSLTKSEMPADYDHLMGKITQVLKGIQGG